MSGRNYPQRKAFYQDLADTFGIFWQFHKERVLSGNLSLAMAENLDTGAFEPYDPRKRLRGWRRREPITDYVEAMKDTTESSWHQFLDGLGLLTGEHKLVDIPVPDEQRRFFDEYTTHMAFAADDGVRLYARTDLKGSTVLSSLGDAGMESGIDATVQLPAIFGEDYSPVSTLQLSKVSLHNFYDGLTEIGLFPRASQTERTKPDYSLLDGSSNGLRRDKLRELGLGDNIGCPASLPVRKETEAYLVDKGVTLATRTMLEDLSQMTADHFQRDVMEPYRELGMRRYISVTGENRRMLDGRVRSSIGRETPRCPYGKER